MPINAPPPPKKKRSAKQIRAHLRHAAFTRMPNWLSGGKLALARSVRRIECVQRVVELPSLAADLEGLRITHVSDLHIGHILGPESLPEIMASVNALKGDLIAVTGDFVDLSIGVLDHVIAGLQSLKAPLGVHLVLGNHDYLDDGPQLIERFRAAGLGLLVNETVKVQRGNSHLLIGGIDFAHQHDQLGALVQHTFRQAQPVDRSSLRLLLAHHPHAFDHACLHDVHLTLSGHTHGGQLVVANTRGKRGSIGLGSLGFRYPRGLYRKGHRYLYVTTGVGSWFPLRVKCPAEIASLRLTATPNR
ncbi:MAG: metallophosphoesterase [Phycisphaeraceae bacterium]